MDISNKIEKNTNKFSVLVVDDEIGILNSMKRFLSSYDYRILLADSGEKALNIASKNDINLIVLDLKMPNLNGLQVLEQIVYNYPKIKVIIQTGHGGIKEAVESIKKGAYDFLIKGEPIEIVKRKIEKVYEGWRLEQENKFLKNSQQYEFNFDSLVGDSLPMQILKNMIVRVAPTDTTVLIQGESGTGKELIAKSLHHHSKRKQKPFVALDCAAISESLLESELFGHEKGAFTGADNASQGLIRAAHSGTLFLDEIGEISMQVQAKLLRTIQEKTIRPVGSTKIYHADVRIIAATNKNLLDMVSFSHFRQDLYYRLSTVTLTAPPLRERDNDIALLAQHFLNQYSKIEGKKVVISQASLDILKKYPWPGNVRELDNVLKGLAVFSDTGIIQPTDFPSYINEPNNQNTNDMKKTSIADFEKDAIIKALEITNYNRLKTIELLDISSATLYRKMKKYGIKKNNV